MFQTGIDKSNSQKKVISVLGIRGTGLYKIWGKKEKGKKIYVIDGKKVLIKRLPEKIQSVEEVEKFLQEEILRHVKERKILWKTWRGPKKEFFACLIELEEVEKGAEIDPEPFALARVFLSLGQKNGEVWNITKEKTVRVILEEGVITGLRVYLNGLKEAKAPEGKVILLCGEESRNPEVKEKFQQNRVLELKKVAPSEACALGAALKGIIANHLPDFTPAEGISEKEFRKTLSFLIAGGTIYTLGLLTLHLFTPYLAKKFYQKEVEVFKKAFPWLRAVAPMSQLQAMAQAGKENFYQKLKDVLSQLPPQTQILSLTYQQNKFSVKLKLKATQKVDNLPGKVNLVKKLPDNTQILEVTYDVK